MRYTKFAVDWDEVPSDLVASLTDVACRLSAYASIRAMTSSYSATNASM